MGKRYENRQQVQDEAAELKNRLEETEETLRAIREYLVDAFVVTRENGTQVVTLSDADFPYRMMVEAMNEGAVTLIPDGTIFYCNPRFSEMIQKDGERLIGVRFQDLIPPNQLEHFETLLNQAGRNGMRGEFTLQCTTGDKISVQLSVYRLSEENPSGISIIATDISERIQSEEKIRALASELTIAEQVERGRISQVLHDDLQQRLFAIKAQLSFVSRFNGEGNPAERQAPFDQLLSWLNDAITLTRNLSIDISPSVLRSEGLSEAMMWLASRMKEQYGLQVKVTVEDNLSSLNDHLRVLLFHTVRELLFNVVKHAEIGQATVTIAQSEKQGHITIEDSGKGFDPSMTMKDSTVAHGLLLIQDRLSLVGGRMEVHSVPGNGTLVRIEFPIEESSV